MTRIQLMFNDYARFWLIAPMLLLGTSVAAQNTVPSRIPVFIEDSPVAQKLAEQAQDLRERNRLSDAAAAIQQIIEFYPQKLVAKGPGLYTAATRWVRFALLADTKLLEVYRRVHQPLAERELSRATTPQVDAVRLELTMQHYLMCPAGLEAGLRLAAVHLEQARPTDAASVLDELTNHPDLVLQSPRWHLLQAAAGLFSGDRTRRNRHEALLSKTDDVALQNRLRRWIETLDLPANDPTIDPLKTMPAALLPEPLGEPLWSVTMPNATLPVDRNKARSKRHGDPQFPLPLAQGAHLFVSDGQFVLSIDRRSGRVGWTFPTFDQIPSVLRSRSSRYLVDQRGVALEADRVTAVFGRVSVWPGRRHQQKNTTSLVCMDRRDGQPLWQVQPSQLDERFSTAFFHGTPVMREGRVFALLRRRTQSGGVQDAFVVAVQSGTGQLIWRRHLSSTTATGRYALRRLTQILEHQGKLYISSQLGAVCCLDARSGTTLWLALTPGNNALTESSSAETLQSWQIGPPILVKAGVVVPPGSQRAPALLLDAQTGRILKKLDSPEWAKASYLAPAGEHVLAVGRTVRLFDGQTLKQRWSRTLDASLGTNPTGRAAVTDRHILIPTVQKLVILKLADGSVVANPAIETTGNVLITDGQVVVAGKQRINSYVDWSQAYPILVQAMQNAPDDPHLGLALADAALKARHSDAVLEGVDHALLALNRTEPPDTPQHAIAPKSTAFDRIRWLVNTAQAAELQLRPALFDRLANATTGPADEVTYQLTVAPFLAESGQFDKAVDHYQSILLDPTLSSQLYDDGSNMRQAAMEARLRLQRLIEKAGRSSYGKYEALAEHEMNELTRGVATDPYQLIAVADHYPLADAAVAARIAAADMLADTDEAVSAVTQLRLAYRQSDDPQQVARIVGRLAELFESTGRPTQARRLLEQVRRDHPALMPLRRGHPTPIETWMKDVANARSSLSWPKLTLPLQQPITIPGRLCTPLAQSPLTWPRDMIVTVTEKQIQLYRGDLVQPQWRRPRARGPIELLTLTDDDLLLWFQHHGILLAIDPDTGDPLWPQLRAATMLGLTDDVRAQTDRQPIAPRPRREKVLGLSVAVGDNTICVAGNVGQGVHVIGIDRQQGQILWRVRPPLYRVSSMKCTNDAVALAGISGRASPAKSVIIVLDPMTGEYQFPPIQNQSSTRWLGLNDEGMLFHATDRDVTARHATNGDIAWRLPLSRPVSAQRGRSNGDLLALQEETGAVLVMDARTGELLSRLGARTKTRDPALQIHVDDDRWYLMSPQRISALDTNGRIVWRDAVTDLPKQFLLQSVGDQHVALLSLVSRPDRRKKTAPIDPLARLDDLFHLELNPQRQARDMASRTGWFYRLYVLDRLTGRIVDQRGLGPITKPINPERAILLDNCLMLSTATHTIAIPGSSRTK